MDISLEDHMASNRTQSGNVLFLILIAVALFAALSYAVTQSSRSGSGDAESEQNVISGAQITQYPAAIRTSIIRMIIGGTAANELEFNPPSQFGTLTSDNVGVFHPQGGQAVYQLANKDVMAGGGAGTWIFNGENQINLIGTTNPGGGAPNNSTADVIAFLDGVKVGACQQVNDELGLPTTLPTESGIDITTNMINGVGIGAGGGTIGEDVSELDGQPFGCFEQGGSVVYFHVLIER